MAADDAARSRIRMLEAMLMTIERRGEFDELVWQSADRDQAVARLSEPPWHFSQTAANWVLDQPMRFRTEAARKRLATELSELQAHGVETT
jgi:hypothetical protein